VRHEDFAGLFVEEDAVWVKKWVEMACMSVRLVIVNMCKGRLRV
jgi:hypothetical protein